MSGFVPTDARGEIVRRIAQRHAALRGPLLPVLHAVVEECGWVADEDIHTIAHVLNLSRADVHGVLTFYKDFRRTPPPAHRVAVCRGEACQARGAVTVWEQARARFADRDDVEVDEVFCLGNCALGPSATVDGALRGRVSADTLYGQVGPR